MPLRSLGATMAEIVAFQAVKSFALVGVSSLGISALKGVFGVEDDEEINWERKFKQFYSNVSKDVNPFLIAPLFEDAQIELLNQLAYRFNGGKFKDQKKWEEYMKKKKKSVPFYRYGDKMGFDVPAIEGFGVFQPFVNFLNPQDGLIRSFQLSSDKKVKVQNQYGGVNTYKFKANEEAYMEFMLGLDILSSLRLMDADFYRASKKVQRDVLRGSKVKKRR